MIDEIIIKKNKLIQKKIYMENKIKEINIKIKETDRLLNKICSHNWIIDYIDKPFGEGSNTIKYCEICKLVK